MSIDLNFIVQDKRSGSSKIIKYTLELLKKVKEEERVKICKKIVNTQFHVRFKVYHGIS